MKKRICTKCGIEKDVSEYCNHKINKDGLNTWCKDCCNEISNNYNQNNGDKIKLKRKQWRENNKEVIKERNKKWIEENKEYKIEYRKNNKEKIKEYHKKYTKINQKNLNLNTQKYRNRKKQLPATLTIEQWDKCKKYFDNKCAYCGEEKPLEQDHFNPLTNGGGYTKENIIPSCKSCNCSKKDKLFENWYKKQSYYSEERELKILEYLLNIRKEMI